MSAISTGRADAIRSSYRAFRDDDVKVLLRLYHPEAIWDFTHWEGFPEARTYRGRAGVEEVLRMLREAFGELDVRPVEILEAGEDRIFVEGRVRIRGRASGAEIDAPAYGQVIEFQDDLIARVESYSDVDAARQAAGLARP